MRSPLLCTNLEYTPSRINQNVKKVKRNAKDFHEKVENAIWDAFSLSSGNDDDDGDENEYYEDDFTNRFNLRCQAGVLPVFKKNDDATIWGEDATNYQTIDYDRQRIQPPSLAPPSGKKLRDKGSLDMRPIHANNDEYTAISSLSPITAASTFSFYDEPQHLRQERRRPDYGRFEEYDDGEGRDDDSTEYTTEEEDLEPAKSFGFLLGDKNTGFEVFFDSNTFKRTDSQSRRGSIRKKGGRFARSLKEQIQVVDTNGFPVERKNVKNNSKKTNVRKWSPYRDSEYYQEKRTNNIKRTRSKIRSPRKEREETRRIEQKPSTFSWVKDGKSKGSSFDELRAKARTVDCSRLGANSVSNANFKSKPFQDRTNNQDLDGILVVGPTKSTPLYLVANMDEHTDPKTFAKELTLLLYAHSGSSGNMASVQNEHPVRKKVVKKPKSQIEDAKKLIPAPHPAAKASMVEMFSPIKSSNDIQRKRPIVRTKTNESLRRSDSLRSSPQKGIRLKRKVRVPSPTKQPRGPVERLARLFTPRKNKASPSKLQRRKRIEFQ